MRHVCVCACMNVCVLSSHVDDQNGRVSCALGCRLSLSTVYLSLRIHICFTCLVSWCSSRGIMLLRPGGLGLCQGCVSCYQVSLLHTGWCMQRPMCNPGCSTLRLVNFPGKGKVVTKGSMEIVICRCTVAITVHVD